MCAVAGSAVLYMCVVLPCAQVPKILEFLCSVASDTTVPDELDDTVVGASVSLLGDLTVMLPVSACYQLAMSLFCLPAAFHPHT